MLHSALRIRQVRNAQDKASEKPTDASIPPAPDEPLSDHDLDDDDLIIEPLRESNDYRRLLFQNSISTNSVYLTTSENTWLAKSYRTMVLRWVFQVCDAMGFFDETDIGMANTISASPSSRMRRAAQPAENITRVSTRISVAAAQADPIAMPTSTPFIMQGACAGFAVQVG